MTPGMPRAAVYARYSSDLQDQRSIDDQVALCRDYAARQGFAIAEVYADRATSGASVHGRHAYQRMLVDAEARRFEVILAEDVDRFARNGADGMRLKELAEFLGLKIFTVADGEANELLFGFKSLMSAMFLKTHRLKVHRGQAGRVRAGRSAGGITYGYAVAPGEPGGRVIDDAEAAIVRRIFAAYLAGDVPRTIVATLNREHVTPPRGRDWRPSTLVGNRQRGCGLLRNALYDGRLVWDKVRMIKDPSTGRRVSRPNAPDAWQVTEVPSLRIVDAATFAAAQVKLDQRGTAMPNGRRRQPRYLLSGLLRCGACGGGMAIKDSNRRHGPRLQCGRMKDAGTCDNRTPVSLAEIERRVLASLTAKLRDPRAIEIVVQEYQAERRRLAAGEARQRAQLERRLGEVSRALERALDALLASEAPSETLGPRVTALHEERKAIEAALATAPPDTVVAIHPQAVRRYLAAVEDLAGSMARLADGESPKALRELIDHVLVMPGAVTIEIRGRLDALAGAGLFPTATLWGGSLVAEERYRQYPPRLFAIAA